MLRASLVMASLLAMLLLPVHIKASPSSEAYKLYEKARQTYRAKDFERAREMVEKAYDLSPQIEFEAFAAWCVFRVGDQARGLRTLEALTKRGDLDRRTKRDLTAHLIKMRSEASSVQVKIIRAQQETRLRLNGQLMDLDDNSSISLAPGSHIFLFEGQYGTEEQKLSIPAQETFEVHQSTPGRVFLLNAPQGLVVEAMGRILVQRPLILVPGTHALRFLLDGRPIHEQKIVLPSAGSTRIDLRPFVEASLPEGGRLSLGSESSSSSRLGPMILTGAGLLSLGIAGFFHWKAKSTWSDLRGMDEGPNDIFTGLSQEQAFQDYSAGQPSITKARIFYGVGAIFVLGGGAWWLYSNHSDRPIDLHSTGNNLVLSGTF